MKLTTMKATNRPLLHHLADYRSMQLESELGLVWDSLELELEELKLLVAKKQKQNSFKWLDREIILKKKRFQKTKIQQRSVIHILIEFGF